MNGDNIVFIVGSGRCGTTWLQKILGTHDKIITAQESHIFSGFIGPVFKTYMNHLNNISGRGGTGLPCYFTKEEIIEEMRMLFYRMIRKTEWQEDKYFIEKSPTHALTIDIIKTVLPKAKIIHIVRDPRDVAASMIEASKGWGSNWAPSNIFLASIMWKKYVSSVKKSFENLSENEKYTVRYEDLKSNIKIELEKILNFIDLPSSQNQIEKMINDSNTFQLKKFGEFRKLSGEIVNDPKEFDQNKHRNSRWREDIGRVKGLIVSFILHDGMKRFKYK